MSHQPAQREIAEGDTGVRPGHGSETFFIVGEGVLAESRGGRDTSADGAVTAARSH